MMDDVAASAADAAARSAAAATDAVASATAAAAAVGACAAAASKAAASESVVKKASRRVVGFARNRRVSRETAVRAKHKRAREATNAFPTTSSGRSTARADRFTEKLACLQDCMDALDEERGRCLTANEQAMVVRVHLKVLHSRTANQAKKARRAKTVAPNALDVTAGLTGVSRGTVQNVWAAYGKGLLFTDPTRDTSAAARKSKEKTERIRDNQEVVDLVRGFARARHVDHRQTTATDVMLFLAEKGELGEFDVSDTKQRQAALRCVQRWLVSHGWERGRGGKVRLKETPELLEKRRSYMYAVKKNREAPVGQRKREAFTDESYIHQHYHRDDRTLYDPKDVADVAKKKHRSKGDRYNMIGVILGPDLNKQPEERKDTFEDIGGWYKPAYAKFHAPLRRKKDYHACLDAEWFESWFEKQCKQLQLDGYSVVWYLDNVGYHKASNLARLKKLKKAELFAALRAAPGTTAIWDRFTTKKAVVSFLESLGDLVAPRVVHIAAKYGHEVVYTPPYHSDLQPIELVWAIVKSQVAAKYHYHITMEDVLQRMDEAFAALSPSAVYGCYKKVLKNEKKVWELVRQYEEQEAADEEATVHELKCHS